MRPSTLTRHGAAALVACLLMPAAPAAAQQAAPATAVAAVQASVGFVGKPVRFRGTGVPGARLEIQRLSGRRGWLRTAVARVGPDGRFLARWRADEAGRFPVRVVARATPGPRAAPRPPARSSSSGACAPPGTGRASSAAVPPAGRR